MKGRSLALVRHAKSSWENAELADRDRPLNPRGRRAAAAVGQRLREVGMHPDLALCSPAIRARQTLELLNLAPRTEILIEEELYGASPGDLLARLHRIASEVASALLVGHNPAIEQLSRRLVKDASALPEKFPTGAVADLRIRIPTWAELDSGICRLHAFITPRTLA